MSRILSKREAEVLDLLREGHKNDAIKNILGINEKTVSTYKARLLKKMGLAKDSNVYKVVIFAEKNNYFSKDKRRQKWGSL